MGYFENTDHRGGLEDMLVSGNFNNDNMFKVLHQPTPPQKKRAAMFTVIFDPGTYQPCLQASTLSVLVNPEQI